MGASSCPSHFRILSGVPGAAQLSEVLGVTRQPLAKLAPSPGPGLRSSTVTAWPRSARYQAVVTPIRPAPITTTRT